MNFPWSGLGAFVVVLLCVIVLLPALKCGCDVLRGLFRRPLTRNTEAQRHRGEREPSVPRLFHSVPLCLPLGTAVRYIVPLVCVLACVYTGSTKQSRMMAPRLPGEVPIVQSTNGVPRAFSAADRALGYVVSATGGVSAAGFDASSNALRIARWTRGGYVSLDDAAVPCPFTNLVAGIGGTLTTAPYGIDVWPAVPTNALVLVPAFASNGLIPGVGDFWCATNARVARYVWRDLAFNRSATNLVRFAATLAANGDVVYEYGPSFPTNGYLAALQNGTNILRLTANTETQSPTAETPSNASLLCVFYENQSQGHSRSESAFDPERS